MDLIVCIMTSGTTQEAFQFFSHEDDNLCNKIFCTVNLECISI